MISLQKLKARQDLLTEGQSLRVIIEADTPFGTLSGAVVSVSHETFILRTNAGELIEAKPEQIVGSVMTVR